MKPFMELSGLLSRLRIKANAHWVVKPLLLSAAMALPVIVFSPRSPAAPYRDEVDVSPVADIEARTFDVSVARRSESNKTYLFNDPTEAMPPVGRLLLLKKGPDLAMAFRVLKNYPETKQFAGKRVRRYGDFRLLNMGEAFTAVERLTELSAPEAPSAEDNAELNEVEKSDQAPADGSPDDEPLPTNPAQVPSAQPQANVAASPSAGQEPGMDALEGAAAENADAALEGGEGSPAPENSLEADDGGPERTPDAGDVASATPNDGPYNEDDEQEEPDAHKAMMIEEVEPIDESRHWLSAGMGLYENNQMHYYAGAGMRYGLDIAQRVFLSRNTLQDSISLEGGVGFYRIVDFSLKNDEIGNFSVMPLSGALRYNIMTGKSFGLFFYGGIVQNVVSKAGDLSAEGLKEALGKLGLPTPAAGGGFFMRFGPNWYARADLGLDLIGASLVLRF